MTQLLAQQAQLITTHFGREISQGSHVSEHTKKMDGASQTNRSGNWRSERTPFRKSLTQSFIDADTFIKVDREALPSPIAGSSDCPDETKMKAVPPAPLKEKVPVPVTTPCPLQPLQSHSDAALLLGQLPFSATETSCETAASDSHPTSVLPSVPANSDPVTLHPKAASEKSTSLQLEVIVQRATGLSNFDLFSKSDPYCVCQIMGKPSSTITTPVVQNCCDPVWNFADVLPGYDDGDALQITVFDKDIRFDDYMASATVSRLPFSGKVSLYDAQGK
eukprot:CAMPEP_0180443000 /NCGR_PEP_ID=MMETSP1036_2-20121128/14439_1 /TAXON_ID=632150 /ORGANISM="Azadinium spinosum, Strain 3D9" /LENGTH=276 /DNA_ID=CAMNT_0022449279 /DNA_START=80 /DNA_END=907 /DNA_ORIENTATION=+